MVNQTYSFAQLCKSKKVCRQINCSTQTLAYQNQISTSHPTSIVGGHFIASSQQICFDILWPSPLPLYGWLFRIPRRMHTPGNFFCCLNFFKASARSHLFAPFLHQTGGKIFCWTTRSLHSIFTQIHLFVYCLCRFRLAWQPQDKEFYDSHHHHC